MRQCGKFGWRRRGIWVLMWLCLLAGCSGTAQAGEMSPADIQEFWAQMTSYQATLQITFVSNRSSNTYTVRQQVLMSGPYRMEVLAPEECRGVLTICDGEKTMQKDPSIGMTVEASETPVRSVLFLQEFWQQYLRSPEKVEPEDGEYVWETELSGGHEKLAVQRLWVNAQNGYPKQMEIYDTEGMLSIRVDYIEFQPNVEMDTSLFTIEKE